MPPLPVKAYCSQLVVCLLLLFFLFLVAFFWRWLVVGRASDKDQLKEHYLTFPT